MPEHHPRRAGRPVDTAKRHAIIASAKRIFFEIGFAKASIEQIAADAHVSKVTVYKHFGGKRELFIAAVEDECKRIRHQFSVDQFASGRPNEQLTTFGEAVVTFISQPEMMRFKRQIAAEAENEPDVGAAFLAAGPHRVTTALSKLLSAMNDAKALRIADPEIAAELFISLCVGLGDLERRFGQEPNPARDRERIRAATDLFCRAFANDLSISD